jgi:hypothetical protein
VIVLYLGKVAEVADRDDFRARPPHPLFGGADLGGADPRSEARAESSAHRAFGHGVWKTTNRADLFRPMARLFGEAFVVVREEYLQ